MIWIVFLTLALQSVVYGQTCGPELDIPYTDDTSDQSGNNYQVINSYVTIQNGMGVFDKNANNSNGSLIKVPISTKLQDIQTLVIKTRYQTLPSKYLGNLFTIIPESPGNSLLMFRKLIDGSVTVGMSSDGVLCQITVTNDNVNQSDFVNAVAKLQNGKISLRVNDGIERSQEGCGSQTSISGEIFVGGDVGIGAFNGMIDYTTMYLCDPDEK